MTENHYYIITSLPGLEDLGAAPPMSRSDLLDHVAEQASVGDLIKAVFLSDDLLQRQALVTEEISELDLAVLTDAQVRGDEPLPDTLVAEDSDPALGLAEDQIWYRYYAHVARIAEQQGNAFLRHWVGYEVGLRNALARARATALQLEPDSYLVATELADADVDFNPIVNEWTAAATPLEGLKVLDRARWNWLAEHEGWFSFKDAELIVYAARLMLLWRWHRLNR